MNGAITIRTVSNGLHDVTDALQAEIARHDVETGLVVVSLPHSTASITVTSPWDPGGLEDVHDEICRLIPTRIDFKHQHDTPQDAAGHVKAALVGTSRSFIVRGGRIHLGRSQHIYLWEFDGPRDRTVEFQLVAAR